MDVEQRAVGGSVLARDHLLHNDGQGVRQLVAHALQSGLTHQFGDHHLLGFVGQIAVRIQRRTSRQPFHQQISEHAYLERRHGADRYHRGEIRERGDREQLCPQRVPVGHQIGLGDDRDHRRPLGQAGELVGDEPVAATHRLVRRDAEADHVHLRQGGAHHVVEPLSEQRAGTVQPGGVDQYQLGVVAVHDAPDGVPGRLRPPGGDRDLRADECVGQRGLARVGTSDKARKPRPELRFGLHGGNH